MGNKFEKPHYKLLQNFFFLIYQEKRALFQSNVQNYVYLLAYFNKFAVHSQTSAHVHLSEGEKNKREPKTKNDIPQF